MTGLPSRFATRMIAAFSVLFLLLNTFAAGARAEDACLQHARELLRQVPAEKQPDSENRCLVEQSRGVLDSNGWSEDARLSAAGARGALRRGAMAFATAGRGDLRRGKAGFRTPRNGAVLNEGRILRLPTHAAGIPLVLRPPAVDPVPRLPASQPLQHDFPLERPSVSQHRVDARISGRHRPDARGFGSATRSSSAGSPTSAPSGTSAC